MSFDGIDGIIWTRGNKTAGGEFQRWDHDLINLNQYNQNPGEQVYFDELFNIRQPNISFAASCIFNVWDPLLAIKIISVHSGNWFTYRRKTSRNILFTRFLFTAPPIFLLAVMPSLRMPSLFGCWSTTKCWQWCFWPRVCTFLKFFRDLSIWLMCNNGHMIFSIRDCRYVYFLTVFFPSIMWHSYTASFFLPLRRLFCMIFRPLLVCILWRNPCVLFLRILLGWYVRFILCPGFFGFCKSWNLINIDNIKAF